VSTIRPKQIYPAPDPITVHIFSICVEIVEFYPLEN